MLIFYDLILNNNIILKVNELGRATAHRRLREKKAAGQRFRLGE
jgi:hypothetical protein